MISLNGIELSQQPSELNESPSFVKTDTTSINGNTQRMQYPARRKAQLTFDNLLPETYAVIKQLYDSAQTVTYKNTQSNLGILEFTGILDYSPSSYTKGGSLMVPVTVTITEAIDGSVYDASQDEEESSGEGDV